MAIEEHKKLKNILQKYLYKIFTNKHLQVIGLFLGIAASIATIFTFILLLFAPSIQLGSVEKSKDDNTTIVAYDTEKKTLWTKNLNSIVKKVEVVDIDKNGNLEVIAATYKPNDKDPNLIDPGRIYIFNEDGEKLTEFNTWKKSIYNNIMYRNDKEANVVDFKIVDIDEDGINEIVAIINGVKFAPSRIAVLQFKSDVIQEITSYWNHGFIESFLIEDINADSTKEIICVGKNNLMDLINSEIPDDSIVVSIFVLKGSSIYGQSPPYSGEEEYGSEIWYGYLTNYEYKEIGNLETLGNGETDLKTVLLKLKNGCRFEINYTGRILKEGCENNKINTPKLHILSKGELWRNLSVP